MMIHTYQLTGMTCSSCETKIKNSLFSLPDITEVIVSKDDSRVIITMGKHIALSELQKAIGGPDGKYKISAVNHNEIAEQTKSWLGTYNPLLILFLFITTISILTSFHHGVFHFMDWMNYFMAGFFLSFSFFKLINLAGFADSYAMYDIIARRFKAWGYIYAFIEMALGIAFLTHFYPLVTSFTTFTVMGISIIGVLQSVLNKRKIQCACLGAVFNLPMSTVTIVEDLLMIIMSTIMIVQII